MGLQDRDWYQEEVKRKTSSDGRGAPGQSEFARLLANKDQGGRPRWLGEWLRGLAFFAAIALLYYAWTHFKT